MAAYSEYVDPGAGQPVKPGWSWCQLWAGHLEDGIRIFLPVLRLVIPDNDVGDLLHLLRWAPAIPLTRSVKCEDVAFALSALIPFAITDDAEVGTERLFQEPVVEVELVYQTA